MTFYLEKFLIIWNCKYCSHKWWVKGVYLCFLLKIILWYNRIWFVFCVLLNGFLIHNCSIFFLWQAYEEFVATFEETPVQKGKVWVKAGTFDAGSRSKYVKIRSHHWVNVSVFYFTSVRPCDEAVRWKWSKSHVKILKHRKFNFLFVENIFFVSNLNKTLESIWKYIY